MSVSEDTVQEILNHELLPEEATEIVNDRPEEVQEIVRGVRRHRSGVSRRPRSQAIFQPPSSVSNTWAGHNSSHDVVENSDRADGKAGFETEFATGGSTDKRSADRDGDMTVTEKSLKSFVYFRRGDSSKKSNGVKDGNGKDSEGEEGKEGYRSEGRDAETLDDWRFKRSGEYTDMDLEGDGAPGFGNRAERRWEEMPQKGEGRKRIFKTKRNEEREDKGRAYPERKEAFERTHSGNVKGSKVGDGKLPTRMKVKVGGNVRTLHSVSSLKRKHDSISSDFKSKETQGRTGKAPELVKKRRHRLILQDISDDDDYEPRPVLIKKVASTSPKLSPPVKGRDAVKEIEENTSAYEVGQPVSTDAHSQGVRKSSRVPKKKILEDFEDYVPNDKMRDGGIDGDSNDAGERLQDSPEYDNDAISEKDAGYVDRDASGSDDDGSEDVDVEINSSKAKWNRSKDVSKVQKNVPQVPKGRSIPLTARQRTMQLGKDGDLDAGPSLIEFPTGLAHQSRRGREKLTEEERQVKKTEASNRRKQLVEKAATEIQATAIQKILGQDSSRKRKEERLQKRRAEIEQGKKAAALDPASNIVQWRIGPERTTVWWSQDAELPSMFSTAPTRCPPARENCAAPTCANVYKYRDSKSSLPLCSLQCYRAIHSAPAVLST